MTEKRRRGSGHRDSTQGAAASALEWISAATGLLLAAGILGFIAWQAFTGSSSAPPALSVSAGSIVSTPGGFVVELKARHHSEATAAAVMIEGELKQGGETVEKSQATISYVPGHSERKAGIMFSKNPAQFELNVRAVGYEKP